MECFIAAMTECSKLWEVVYGLTVDQVDLVSLRSVPRASVTILECSCRFIC